MLSERKLHTVPPAGVDQSVRVSTLYRKYGPAIFSRCRRLLKDDALAEDATQEVFVRVLNHIDSAPDDAAALAWIYRISTNYCLNQIRDRSRQAEPTAPDELPEAPGEHPETGMMDRNLAMKLIDRAPEKLRAAALLYYVDGLEQEQVAQTLGISRRTVINRLQEFAERSRRYVTREGEDAA
jgi:RNA polymerase sigma-70 factor (ECF subfamily)